MEETMRETTRAYQEVAISLRTLRGRLERLEQVATAGMGLSIALLLGMALL